MLRIRQTGRAVSDFLSHGIWHVDHAGLGLARRWGVRVLQFFALVGGNSRRDAILLRASAMTFTSVLAIVPLAGILLAVLSGFHLENNIDELLARVSAGNADVEATLRDLAQRVVGAIDQTNLAAVGAVSFVVVLASILSLLTAAENSFNSIFKARRSRPFFVRVRDYTFLVVVTPVLLIVGVSLMTAASDATIGAWLHRLTIARRAFESMVAPYPALSESADFWLVSMDHMAAFGFTTLRLIPLLIIWLLFALIYITLPYTRISVWRAIGGAVVAGTAWQGAYLGYLTFQFGLARYNTIYGSLASLPFFLMWLYVSWVILLVGAEIVQASETLEGHRELRRLVNPSPACREKIALRLMASVARRFAAGKGATPIADLAVALDVPQHLVASLANTLAGANLLLFGEGATESGTVVPARPAEAITVHDIYDAVREDGDDIEVVSPENPLERFLVDDAEENRRRLSAQSLASVMAEG